MKKLVLFLMLGATVMSIASMDSPRKERGARRRLFVSEPGESTQRTSPSKYALGSPDAGIKSKRKTPTGYSETERESEVDRKIAEIPVITRIRNNFNFPILIGLPLTVQPLEQAKALMAGEERPLNNLMLSERVHLIISANNKIHEIRYFQDGLKKYFLDTINDASEMEWMPTNKKVEIEIDDQGNLHFK